ncbi:hypothetical protein DFH09DRAFT_1099548 [Mycena vulgaris]|nr:hypothetical protein DFH09DRAFT_1099548 [Mycena vulgaris]
MPVPRRKMPSTQTFPKRSEIIKVILFFSSMLIVDSLIIYRLWIIWGLNCYVIIFPMFTLMGTFVTSIGNVPEFAQWEPRLREALFYKESKPWTATGSILSLLYSFLSILVESAALQTYALMDPHINSVLTRSSTRLWLCFNTITQLANSDTELIPSDTFPVIIGVPNLLIHARVGLGWSQDSAAPRKTQGTLQEVTWVKYERGKAKGKYYMYGWTFTLVHRHARERGGTITLE